MSDPIRFDGVRRSFGDQQVLRGLDFRVRPGEIYALLGRNGAGKTTALSILLGFLEPMAGHSSLLGEDSRNLTARARDRVGLVTEGHVLYRWMSVRRALDFEAGTRRRFDRAWAEDALRRLDLPLRRRISRLSRGMRAQLSLVLALAGDPEVLVLDDPAMGLDAVMRREFLDAMIELLGREGRSVLFSSHVMSDVERVADRVGILHGGRLIVDATIDDLKRRVQKRFARLAPNGTPAEERLPGLLCAHPARDGFELTLLDVDDERERRLREATLSLTDPVAPSLEELFVDLTGERGREALLAPGEGTAR